MTPTPEERLNRSRLDAWIHWKTLELKKFPDEGEELFLSAIKQLKSENQRLRGALEKVDKVLIEDIKIFYLRPTDPLRAFDDEDVEVWKAMRAEIKSTLSGERE